MLDNICRYLCGSLLLPPWWLPDSEHDDEAQHNARDPRDVVHSPPAKLLLSIDQHERQREAHEQTPGEESNGLASVLL